MIFISLQVRIKIEHNKTASNSFAFQREEDEGVDGYEMMPVLGTNLSFSCQYASISSYEDIEIIRQNFGFDLAQGITEVELNMEESCYSIEVKGLLESVVEESEEESVFRLNWSVFGFVPVLLFFFGIVAIMIILVKLIERYS